MPHKQSTNLIDNMYVFLNKTHKYICFPYFLFLLYLRLCPSNIFPAVILHYFNKPRKDKCYILCEDQSIQQVDCRIFCCCNIHCLFQTVYNQTMKVTSNNATDDIIHQCTVQEEYWYFDTPWQTIFYNYIFYKSFSKEN